MDDMKFKEAEFLRQLELEHLEKTMEYEYYEDIKARRRRTLMIILATLAPLPIFIRVLRLRAFISS